MLRLITLSSVAIGLCCLLLEPNLGKAQSSLITYSGRLADGTGWGQSVPVDLELRLYGTEVGGEPLWRKAFPGVAVEDGFFTVMMGDGFGPGDEALGIDTVFASTQQTWLGVTVEGTELARQGIASVPYAVRAESADLLRPSGQHNHVFLLALLNRVGAQALCNLADNQSAPLLYQGRFADGVTGDELCAANHGSDKTSCAFVIGGMVETDGDAGHAAELDKHCDVALYPSNPIWPWGRAGDESSSDPNAGALKTWIVCCKYKGP